MIIRSKPVSYIVVFLFLVGAFSYLQNRLWDSMISLNKLDSQIKTCQQSQVECRFLEKEYKELDKEKRIVVVLLALTKYSLIGYVIIFFLRRSVFNGSETKDKDGS